jgi:acetoacetate decarboxylase
MLYTLSRDELATLRSGHIDPEFTGAEMLMASFRTDPDVVRRILPKPLKPAPRPMAVAFVARYPETNFGCVYNEGALFLNATHRGEEGLYCLSMPVDDDMAMIGGREQFGFPKKMAEITLEQEGSRRIGRVVRKGVEILRIECETTDDAEDADLERFSTAGEDSAGKPCRNAVSYLFKFFPSAKGDGFDYLPRLIRQVTVFRPRPGLKKGDGEVVLTSSPFDPLGDVPVEEVQVCIYGLWDNTMLPGRRVARVWNPLRFARHAFFKTDFAPQLLGEV